MKINKLNKIFKNILILFSAISLLAAFFIEQHKTFSLTDILFLTILIILLALLLCWKKQVTNTPILFYDFILISSVFIYDLKTTLIILIASEMLKKGILYFYYKETFYFFNSPEFNEVLIIINSLFLANGAFIVFSQYINDAPLLFSQIIIFNTFQHIFYLLLKYVTYIITLTEQENTHLLDSVISILINFAYSTVFTYLGLVLYTILGYPPILTIFLLNTTICYLFIKNYKITSNNRFLSKLKDIYLISLSPNHNFSEKIYSYIDVLKELIPCSLISIYPIFENYRYTFPICYRCEENISLNNLKLDLNNQNELKDIMESERSNIIKGYRLKNSFSFVSKFNLLNSNFIIVPICYNSPPLAFILIKPKTPNKSYELINNLVDVQQSISLLLIQNYKYVDLIPKSIENIESFISSLDLLISNKVSFTLNVIRNNSQVDIVKYLIKNSDKLDKVFLFNSNHIYVIHAIKDTTNVRNYMKTLTLNNPNLSFSTFEFPIDVNNIKEIITILKTSF
ncbi:hypothetical protein [Clostridium paraputrificum]|uniref:hypothetical protein n=1 Tax=Clostridium paraputrificum TaxID=29363 RepID=UPI0006C337E0|nr:hypothetical protein [Clostridium paraputrificum]CUN84343.1 Uncharacterised protein [Clostridium paraputrificum]